VPESYYTVILRTGLGGQDNDGVTLRQAYSWSFTTGTPTAVSLVGISSGSAVEPWWLQVWPFLMVALSAMTLFTYAYLRRRGMLDRVL
jgi:hypothetical protein